LATLMNSGICIDLPADPAAVAQQVRVCTEGNSNYRFMKNHTKLRGLMLSDTEETPTWLFKISPPHG
jgi:hypothetical protein